MNKNSADFHDIYNEILYVFRDAQVSQNIENINKIVKELLGKIERESKNENSDNKS